MEECKRNQQKCHQKCHHWMILAWVWTPDESNCPRSRSPLTFGLKGGSIRLWYRLSHFIFGRRGDQWYLWHQLTQAAALHPSVAAPLGGCVHWPWSWVANSRTYAKCCDMCMRTHPGCRMDDTLTAFVYDYTLTMPHLSLLESSDAGDCVTVSQVCIKTSTA